MKMLEEWEKKSTLMLMGDDAMPEDTLDLDSPIARPETRENTSCLLYTSPSPRDRQKSRMPSSA